MAVFQISLRSPLGWIAPLVLALGGPAAGGAALTPPASPPLEVLFERTPGELSAPFLPDALLVDSQGNLLLVGPGTLTKLSASGAVLWTTHGPPAARFRALNAAALDPDDSVLALDTAARTIYAFAPDGRYLREIRVRSFAMRLVVNDRGEIVTNPGASKLFDVYSSTGELVRSFGELRDFGNVTANFELNAGDLAAGSGGEIYISLPYPPAVTAFSRGGDRLWQAPIPIDPPPPVPRVASADAGDRQVSVSFDYHLASLGLGVDRAGRILTLASGKPHHLAHLDGSDRLEVFSAAGDHLGSAPLPVPAQRLGVSSDALYLLQVHPFGSEPRLRVSRMPLGSLRPDARSTVERR